MAHDGDGEQEVRRSARIQMKAKHTSELIKRFWNLKTSFTKELSKWENTLNEGDDDEEKLESVMIEFRTEKVGLDAIYEDISGDVKEVPQEITLGYRLVNKKFMSVMKRMMDKLMPEEVSDENQEDEKTSELDAQLDGPTDNKASPENEVDIPVSTVTHDVPTATSSTAPQEVTSTIEHLSRSLFDSVNMSRLPAPEPPVFEGDPLNFTIWKSAFTSLIEGRNISCKERIHYLQRYLGGEAKECVSSLFYFDTEEAYNSAWTMLNKRYGNPFQVSEAFRQKLIKWPEVSNANGKELRQFSDFLAQCVVAKRQVSGLNILDDCHENRRILRKLPRWIQNEWSRKVCDHESGNFPTFEEFAMFIAKIADRLNNPIFSDLHEKPKRTTNSRSFNTSTTNQTPQQKTAPELRNPSLRNTSQKSSCAFCKMNNHIINNCRKFREITADSRSDFVKKNRLCFGCLKYGHLSKDCRGRSKCDICTKSHPTCLHGDNEAHKQSQVQEESSLSMKSDVGHKHLSSMIVPVYVSSNNDADEYLVYAMLDTQSDSTFITEDLARKLHSASSPARLQISTMTAKTVTNCRKYYGLKVRAYDSKEWINLPPTYSKDHIPANRNHIPDMNMIRQWKHLSPLKGKLPPLQECEVGLLIGFNCPDALAPLEVILGARTEPYAQKTVLGWSIVGSNITSEDQTTQESAPSEFCDGIHISHRVKTQDLTTSELIKSMESDFKDSSHNSIESMSQDDLRFLTLMKNGIRQDRDNFYEMPLPFKSENPNLPLNKDIAMQRLIHLKKRFTRSQKYFEDYKTFMENIISSGDVEAIPESENPRWYVPHHGVYHPRKNKLRVVFDCSATYHGMSLNQCLLQGPDQMNSLVGVLCRFREEPIAICSDIERMFHQFRVRQEDRNYLCFLWWQENDLNKPVITYRMKVHLFGATSSPACAIFGLKRLAEDYGSQFGCEVERFLKNDFYMDDGLTSCSTVEEAKSLTENSVAACKRANIRLHKFLSNSRQLMECLPCTECQNVTTLDLTQENLPVERVLGIQWSVVSDEFKFRLEIPPTPITRRGILSTVASVFDPLGCLAPFILTGKQILQETCREDTGWDEPISPELEKRWERWLRDAMALPKLTLARCFKPKSFGDIVRRELHHFSDASQTGYGSCSYIRQVNTEGKIHCALVTAKSRVAPLKGITLPRLELSAAVTATKMSLLLRKELRYKIEEYFWTDSKIVIGYIGNDSKRFHVFVANRVQQIREISDPKQWNYVKTDENPADLASRGGCVEDLVSGNWFKGPAFLWNPIVNPQEPPSTNLDPTDPEIKGCNVLKGESQEIKNPLLERFLKFSDWDRLISAFTTLKAFASRTKANKVTVVESRQVTQTMVIKAAQEEHFYEFIYGANKVPQCLSQLDPFLDEEGVLRVGGRLKHSSIPYGVKHPIILQKSSHIAKLLIKKCHEEVAHQGRGFTLSHLREKGYWILGARGAVASCIFKCVLCKRLRGKLQEQKMADLPRERLEPSPPFTHLGIDCFGPFLTKDRRKEQKKYGLIVVCLASKAIHIELLDDLTTDSFINGLRCLIALRGPVRTIRCDQGSNFIGAVGELDRAVKEVDNQAFREFLHKRQCVFLTNIPSSSHMGGIWERQIRTVRNILTVMLNQHGSRLDTTTLRTLLYEVMAIVNSRPLNVDDLTDPKGPEPLTPNHLITMKSELLVPPPGNFVAEDIYARKRWRQVQALANHFWDRWRKAYLVQLQERQKWRTESPNLEAGDIVLLKEENDLRGHHRLARITNVLPGSDDLVRKVELLVADRTGGRPTVLYRPIHKLILLIKNTQA